MVNRCMGFVVRFERCSIGTGDSDFGETLDCSGVEDRAPSGDDMVAPSGADVLSPSGDEASGSVDSSNFTERV